MQDPAMPIGLIARLVRAAKWFAPGVFVGWAATCAVVALDARAWPGVLALSFGGGALGLNAWLLLALALVPLAFWPERLAPGAEPQLTAAAARELAVQVALAGALTIALRLLGRPFVPARLAYPDTIAFAFAAYGGAAGAAVLTALYDRLRRKRPYPLWTAGVLFIAARFATHDATHLIAQGYEHVIDVLALVTLSTCGAQLGRAVVARARPAFLALVACALVSIALLLTQAGARPAAYASFARAYPGTAQLVAPIRAIADLDRDGSSGWLGGDCDEGDPNISPLAIEIVGNGVDDNCMGGDLAAVPAVPPRALDAGALKHDLVLITMDAVRADMLDAEHMPEVTRLAQSAVVFENAYAAAPFTSGSVPTMMTGHYLMSTGATWEQNLDQEDSLAELLSQAGYATSAVIHPFWDANNPWVGAIGFKDVEYVKPEEYIDTSLVSGPAVTERALAVLARLKAASQPFFLWIHYLDPHAQYVARPGTPFSKRTDAQARYEQEVWSTDREVGRVAKALESSGFFERGVLAVHSDHGELIDDRGRTGHALWLDEDVIRTLLVVRAPGIAARRVATRVRLIDLFPTFLSYAGASVSSTARSLASVMRGEELRDRDAIVYSFYADTRQAAVLSGDYKLRLDYVRGTAQLYDVKREPRETTDLIERQPEVAQRLRDLLGEAWDLELNDHVVQNRTIRSLQRLCDRGDARACAILRGAAGSK